MSVIVKGMMLPDCCAACELTDSDDDGIYCNVLEEFMRFDELPKGRRSDCPIFDENTETLQSIVINDRYGNVAEYAKVIRCMDCKYYREDGDCWHEWDNDGRVYYQSVINEPNPDDYCSKAEPKETEKCC